jgi:signal transduction histidine kinase
LNRRLQRANHELTLAAKTSAVGAVASHLIHGLKNPLAGLQQFVSGGSDGASGVDWTDAAATARRMKAMIDEVVRVLREDSGVSAYEITTTELLHLVTRKAEPLAKERSVRLVTRGDATGMLPNRDANLVLLILENLVLNAIQATPADRTTSVTMSAEDGHLVFFVRDQGPGLPTNVRANLFTPVASTKAGGTGLGLALSSQLARHLGADLALVRTGSEGTEFRLRLAVPVGAATAS